MGEKVTQVLSHDSCVCNSFLCGGFSSATGSICGRHAPTPIMFATCWQPAARSQPPTTTPHHLTPLIALVKQSRCRSAGRYPRSAPLRSDSCDTGRISSSIRLHPLSPGHFRSLRVRIGQETKSGANCLAASLSILIDDRSNVYRGNSSEARARAAIGAQRGAVPLPSSVS